MLTSTETNPFLNFKLASPDEEDTSTQALVPMRPTTPILDKSVVLDLTPDHGTAPTYSLVETPPNLEPSFNVIALHSSPNMMKLWNQPSPPAWSSGGQRRASSRRLFDCPSHQPILHVISHLSLHLVHCRAWLPWKGSPFR
jgi:hypothetical protein